MNVLSCVAACAYTVLDAMLARCNAVAELPDFGYRPPRETVKVPCLVLQQMNDLVSTSLKALHTRPGQNVFVHMKVIHNYNAHVT